MESYHFEMTHRKTRSTLAVNFSRVGNYYFSPAPTPTFSRRSAMHCSALPCTDTHHTPVHLLNCLNDGRLQREARSIYERQLRSQIIHRSENFNCDSWRFVAVWSEVGLAMQTGVKYVARQSGAKVSEEAVAN